MRRAPWVFRSMSCRNRPWLVGESMCSVRWQISCVLESVNRMRCYSPWGPSTDEHHRQVLSSETSSIWSENLKQWQSTNQVEKENKEGRQKETAMQRERQMKKKTRGQNESNADMEKILVAYPSLCLVTSFRRCTQQSFIQWTSSEHQSCLIFCSGSRKIDMNTYEKAPLSWSVYSSGKIQIFLVIVFWSTF